MAIAEHLDILSQGVAIWNTWRKLNPSVKPDLSGSDLSHRELDSVNFISADLSRANLKGTGLVGALLGNALLIEADLTNVGMGSANLYGTIFHKTILRPAFFGGAWFGGTVLSDVDLSEAVWVSMYTKLPRHVSPSTITLGTLRLSKNRIPRWFLEGCGLQYWEILMSALYQELTPAEVAFVTDVAYHYRIGQRRQKRSFFISYSHADSLFVDRLQAILTENGIESWRDSHHLRSGRLEAQVLDALHDNPLVILVLSENSVESDWVEWEAAKAREYEKILGRDVLCPIALDRSWQTCSWPGVLRRQIEDYHILDFAEWREENALQRQFEKLIEGVAVFYDGQSR